MEKREEKTKSPSVRPSLRRLTGCKIVMGRRLLGKEREE